MSNYRKGSHSVFSIHLHLVWITKYRKKILSGDIAQMTMSLIRGICEKHQVEILKGHIAPDHIHLFVSIPPNLAVSKLMQQLKGRTSHAMIRLFLPILPKIQKGVKKHMVISLASLGGSGSVGGCHA